MNNPYGRPMENGSARRTNLWRLIRYILWLTSAWLTATNARAQSSVLREGAWVKIGVTASGVYRLDQPTLARLNPLFAQADPRLLRLYGNGGAPLPQPNATPRAADLTENAVVVEGQADGRFDAGDALLFFGQSPHVIRYDSTAGRFTHQINPYTDTTYYFLTIGTAPGRRIVQRPAGDVPTAAAQITFTDYQFHELDQQKVQGVRSGRQWLGEYLTADVPLVIPFAVPGLVAAAPVQLTASVVAGSVKSTTCQVDLDAQRIGSLMIPAVSGGEYDYQAAQQERTFSVRSVAAQTVLPVRLTFRKDSAASAQAYLNYVAIQFTRTLRQYDAPTWARRLSAGSCAVGGATNLLRIWDVTDPLAPAAQGYVLTGTGDARWAAPQPGDYFLFTDAQMLTPASLALITNQNLRGQPTPNLLIVVPNAWRGEAERLAQFRRDHDGLTALVITTQQVYNEFGSGQPDPTAIRDLARYLYRQTPNQLRYLLLFGDATFDYRNIMRLLSPAQQASTVPVYESRESLHPVLSFSSDDYYGLMGEADGEWSESAGVGPASGEARLAIGIGRLPVKSVGEAQTVVDKLIRYETDKTLAGDWQTKVMLVADEGDYDTHQQDANLLATQIETSARTYRPERLFLNAYPTVSTNGQRTKPAVNQAINQAMTDGRLIINYSGHGGEDVLANTHIVTLADILGWRNRRMPLFVTATCQFGRYDEPTLTSGAELALLSRSGGAIGLLTTTRPVYSNTNLILNKAFYKSVFRPVNGQMPRLGDVLRLTKNDSLVVIVNRNFALLGDPSMQLAYPNAQAVLTGVNGRAVAPGRADTLRALQTVELTGEIRQQNRRMANFSGTVQAVLYDKADTLTTLGGEASPKMSYPAYDSRLFAGQVPVRQGQFALRFTLPKDIKYAVGRGRLVFYALQSDSLFDAAGSADSLFIGGSVTPGAPDTQPPSLTLAVVGSTPDGETLRVAGPDVTLRVDLTDDQGINIARSGLGHELTIQLNDNVPVLLNDRYVATDPTGRGGTALYTFAGLAAGRYTARVKAWDINNNSTGQTLAFLVSDKPALRVQTLRISPNPVQTTATLTAEHNRVGEPLDWTTGIYDLNGRLLIEQTGQCTDCSAALGVGQWDGRSLNGAPLPGQVYIVRVRIQSAADGSVATGQARLLLAK